MRRLAAVLGMWAALCAAAMAQEQVLEQALEHDTIESPSPVAARPIGQGMASWYGPRFHGRRTASGEAFDMHELTAAHPTLPFGTLVRVTSLVNGRAVQVRINDRGPYVGRRIIDLSRAAAQALGLVQSGRGVKPVSLAIVER